MPAVTANAAPDVYKSEKTAKRIADDLSTCLARFIGSGISAQTAGSKLVARPQTDRDFLFRPLIRQRVRSFPRLTNRLLPSMAVGVPLRGFASPRSPSAIPLARSFPSLTTSAAWNTPRAEITSLEPGSW